MRALLGAWWRGWGPGSLTDLLDEVPIGWQHWLMTKLGVIDQMHDTAWLPLCACGVVWTCEPLGSVA